MMQTDSKGRDLDLGSVAGHFSTVKIFGAGIISQSGEVAAFYLPPGLFLNLHKIRVDSDNKR